MQDEKEFRFTNQFDQGTNTYRVLDADIQMDA